MSPALTPKFSTSELLPGIGVSLNAKPPFATYEVVVYARAGSDPQELYSGLRAVGFKARAEVLDQPNGVRQSFGRDGSGMFASWTTPERERFLGEARRTLRRFGFAFVPEIHEASDNLP